MERVRRKKELRLNLENLSKLPIREKIIVEFEEFERKKRHLNLLKNI